MRASVDNEKCQAHNRCFAAYPHIFELDDDLKAYVKLSEIPLEWQEDIRTAAANCPERAIKIES
jgi:ferredoxin